MKFWNWLDGKKTVIAEFYWTAFATIILIWYPNGLPEVPNKAYLSIGILFTFCGLGHKAFKKAMHDDGPEQTK